MKTFLKSTALLIILSFCGKELFAQGFYFRGGLGYAIPQAGQTLDGTGTPYSGTSNNTMTIDSTKYTSYNISKVSFTSGVHISIAGGYMFNKHVGVDLSASFGMSNTQYIFNDNNVTIGGVPCNVQFVTKAINPIMLMPSLVLQSGGDVLNLYTRFGIAIPLKTYLQQDQLITNLPGTGTIETDDYVWKISNAFSLGITAAAGVQYKITDNIKVWGEASMLSLTVFAKESDMTEVTVNGQGGYLSQVPVAQQKIYYSSNFNSTTSDYFHQPTFSQPFSNVAFNVGFTYLFPRDVTNTKNSHGHHGYKKPALEDKINRV